VEYYVYLCFQFIPLLEEVVIVGLEAVIASLQNFVILLKLFGLPPSPAVLKPNGNLTRLQAKVLCELGFPFGFKLVIHLETFLQKLDLVDG
jgi:hypothetical protein